MATKTGVVRRILFVSGDPSAGGGTPATINTIAEDTTTGFLWVKTGAGNTAWSVVGAGGSNVPIVQSLAANGTLNSNTDILFIDPTAGAFNVQLSSPALQTKQKCLIVDISGVLNTNNVTLVRFAAESIAGLAASKLLQTNWGTYNLTTNLTNWFI